MGNRSTNLHKSIVIVFKCKENKRLKFIRSKQTICKYIFYLGEQLHCIHSCLPDSYMGLQSLLWQIVFFPENAVLVILKLLRDIIEAYSSFCLCGNLKYYWSLCFTFISRGYIDSQFCVKYNTVLNNFSHHFASTILFYQIFLSLWVFFKDHYSWLPQPRSLAWSAF